MKKFNLIEIKKDKLIINSNIFYKECYSEFKKFTDCMEKNNCNYVNEKKCMKYLKNWKICLSKNF